MNRCSNPAAMCNDCSCSSEDIAFAGGKCPRSYPETRPGALHDLKEKKPTPSGFFVALLARVGFVVLVVLSLAAVAIDLATRGFVVAP